MKFSIVVAAYNVAEYLEECVDSLADQNFPNSEYEVVIVDDGSTDGQTSKLCDESILKVSICSLSMVMIFGVLRIFLKSCP